MHDSKTDNQRVMTFFLISIALHLVFILLLPGFGLMPRAAMSLGNAVEITFVSTSPPVVVKPPTTPTQQPKAPEPVVDVQKPTPPKPSELPQPPVTKPQEPEVSIPDRIITQPASPEEVAEEQPREQPPVEQKRETVAEAEETPPVVEEPPEPEPPTPPLVGDVVSGYGVMRHYPAKEAALLTSELRAQVKVTVDTNGQALNPVLLTPSGHTQLDIWVTQMAARQLKFAPTISPYEVTVEVHVHPSTRKVTMTPLGERVRFLDL